MAKVVGGKLITYSGGGATLPPPHAVGGVVVHEPPTIRTPLSPADVVPIGPPHIPAPVETFTVTGATAAPPHLASLGQAFSFAQSNFPAGNGAVTITRKHLLAE